MEYKVLEVRKYFEFYFANCLLESYARFVTLDFDDGKKDTCSWPV